MDDNSEKDRIVEEIHDIEPNAKIDFLLSYALENIKYLLKWVLLKEDVYIACHAF